MSTTRSGKPYVEVGRSHTKYCNMCGEIEATRTYVYVAISPDNQNWLRLSFCLDCLKILSDTLVEVCHMFPKFRGEFLEGLDIE